MPFVVAGKPIPEITIKKGKKLNKLFLILNSLFPLIYIIDLLFLVTIPKKFPDLNEVF